jgi:hypothetical protein
LRKIITTLLLLGLTAGCSSFQVMKNTASPTAPTTSLSVVKQRLIDLPDILDRMDQRLEESLATPGTRATSANLGRWDKPLIYSNGCHTSWSSDRVNVCYSGTSDGPLLVSTGDSHAAHLQPGLERWATEHGWRYASITKAGCPVVDVKPILAEESKLHLGLPYPSCVRWQKSVVAKLREIKPDVVVLPLLSRRGLYGGGGQKAWSEGISRTTRELSNFAKVVVIGDDPKVGFDVPSCLQKNQDSLKCAKPTRESVLVDRLNMERDATLAGGGFWFDISPWFCTAKACPMVVDGVVVRRDDNHLTAEFAEYLWPRFSQITPLEETKDVIK